jgi:hypothetical protein
MALDHFIKEFFRDIFVSAHVETDLKVGTLPLQIDCIIEIPDQLNKSTNPLPFPIITDKFLKFNLFEFKSYHDTPKLTDLSKLMGYLGLWCVKNQKSVANIN